MGNIMTVQVCDPTGSVYAGDGILSFTATTFTTVCPGVQNH